MSGIIIKTIPACFAYTAEYDLPGVDSFFNTPTSENILYDLQYEMEADNPDVKLPPEGEDYNVLEYPMEDNGDGTVHIVYYDMVYNKGTDSPVGSYRFIDVPEIEAAVMMHKGPFSCLGEGFEKVYEWIEANGYEIAGTSRMSAFHGPWDTENPEDYEHELQVPIRKK